MKGLKFVLFWILSCTWGAIMTVIGLIVAGVLIVKGYKPRVFHYSIYFQVGSDWGGINLGAVFITSTTAEPRILQHEAGHGIQNIVFGPLMPFLVGIPSITRYHYRNYLETHKNKKDLPPYDSIWFEGQASRIGTRLFDV